MTETPPSATERPLDTSAIALVLLLCLTWGFNQVVVKLVLLAIFCFWTPAGEGDIDRYAMPMEERPHPAYHTTPLQPRPLVLGRTGPGYHEDMMLDSVV